MTIADEFRSRNFSESSAVRFWEPCALLLTAGCSRHLWPMVSKSLVLAISFSMSQHQRVDPMMRAPWCT